MLIVRAGIFRASRASLNYIALVIKNTPDETANGLTGSSYY